MAPARSPSSSQFSQSQKKQQSISSFFTKSAPQPAAKPAERPPPPAGNNQDGDSLFVSSDEERATSNGRISKKTKRTVHQDELDDDDDLPIPKRLRQAVDNVENEASMTSDPDGQEEAGRAPRGPGQSVSHTAANDVRPPRITDRTSKYLFSSSPIVSDTAADEDKETRKRKELLHQKFVRKLGRPDSIAEIKRRNHFITEETQDAEGEGEEDMEEEEAPSRLKAERAWELRKEKQIIDIKRKNMDTLLVVEVGYKFKFFGEDARIAAKELGIVCIPGKYRYDEHPSEAHIDRFASASFPVHRLHVHVKRLVAAGHKIGVVRQLETAALKAAGDNRNTPFVRKLTNLYTKGTYIDDVEGLEGLAATPISGAPATGHLLCLTETNAKGWGTDEKVHIGLVAVQPTTGDVVYDDFQDGFMRSELETRLLHIAPCEFLIVGDVSRATDKLVQHLSGSKTNVFGDRARVERVEKPKTMAAQAYSHISSFYAEKMNSVDSTEEHTAMLDEVHKLSEHVTICLSAMITHLTDYGLEHVFDLTKYFQSFSARSHMLLNGNTLNSLEIYQNQTDRTDKGACFGL
ncbi:Mismatch repair protein msh3 [Taxawa tesnikishii (nom. ined.)]|nr:Mismatch repair protein msh3 [Dothideales sp. JES 119]